MCYQDKSCPNMADLISIKDSDSSLKQNVAQMVCDFQIELLNMPIYLKITLPLCGGPMVNLLQWVYGFQME